VISRVKGTLLRRELDGVEIMTAGGTGYDIRIPLSVYERLPRVGEPVELRTHQVVREDEVSLYGFLEERSRLLFVRLMSASGVGPRLALTMLSTLSPDRLVRAIADRDLALLTQVPGIGKKTAERIALELGDRLDDSLLAATDGKPAAPGAEDAVNALVALGYNQSAAGTAVRKALDEEPGLEGVGLIRAALARAVK